MITRNEVKMVVFAIVGIAFISAGLFSQTINAGAGKPYRLKWYHRVFAIVIGINSIIIAIRLYGQH